MMRLWIGITLIGLVILGFTGKSALRAHAAAREFRVRLATLTDQARELSRLRNSSQELSLPMKPAGGLAAKVSAVLARCGLPASALQNLSPESDSLTSARAVKERATLTFSGLTLPQVGAFLNAWRGGEADPAGNQGGEGGWTVSSIDLSPIERPDAQKAIAATGADLPLRAVITVEGLFRATLKDLPKGR